MLYIRDMGMATYNLLNFKMRPVLDVQRKQRIVVNALCYTSVTRVHSPRQFGYLLDFLCNDTDLRLHAVPILKTCVVSVTIHTEGMDGLIHLTALQVFVDG